MQHAFGHYSAVVYANGPEGINDPAGLLDGIELEMLHDGDNTISPKFVNG